MSSKFAVFILDGIEQSTLYINKLSFLFHRLHLSLAMHLEMTTAFGYPMRHLLLHCKKPWIKSRKKWSSLGLLSQLDEKLYFCGSIGWVCIKINEFITHLLVYNSLSKVHYLPMSLKVPPITYGHTETGLLWSWKMSFEDHHLLVFLVILGGPIGLDDCLRCNRWWLGGSLHCMFEIFQLDF